MRVLTDEDVAGVLSLPELLSVVETAFVKQGRGEVERPDRPHFPVGAGIDGLEPLGTGLTMPAYLHGSPYVATKLVTVHERNPDRGLPTIHAQLVLADAETGVPRSFVDAHRITNARTGCIGGLAARELAVGDTVGVLGAGAQARWQVRAIDAAREVGEVRVYSPSDSRETCAADLRVAGIEARAVDTPRECVEGADVVVTATTSERPVFPADALSPGALVIAVGAYTAEMCELDPEVFERASQVFADVPEEVVEIGDAIEAGLSVGDLTPLSAVFEGRAGRTSEAEILVVESVGTAVLDAATAELVYDRAVEADVGTVVPF